MAGVPGTTTGATVMVVVAADPELPEPPVEIGAIEAAVVVDVVVELVVVVAVGTVLAIVVVVAVEIFVAGLVVTVFVEPLVLVPELAPPPAPVVGIKLIISMTPFFTPESTFLATP